MVKCKGYSALGCPENPDDLCYSCLKGDAEVCNKNMQNPQVSWDVNSGRRAVYGIMDRDSGVDIERTAKELDMSMEMLLAVCATMTEQGELI